MWQSTILNISNKEDVLIVTVQYSNGTDSFTRDIDVSGQSADTITQSIQNVVDTLNSNTQCVEALTPTFGAVLKGMKSEILSDTIKDTKITWQ